MAILNISIDLISSSIIEIHGPVDFDLLKQFEEGWLVEDYDGFREHFKKDTEWCELMLTVVPAEYLDGRITAPSYYDYKILDEGNYS
jgi:hypothetical protein